MSIYDRLAAAAQPASLTPEETSYFSAPAPTLDPKLFTDKEVLKPSVRSRLLSTIHTWMDARYRGSDQWLRVYLAGSGVSYQWTAAREPGDLDVLLGVDFVDFRRCNPDFRDLGDAEIAHLINEELRTDLWPKTSEWRP